MKNSQEQNRGSILRQIRTDVTLIKTSATNIPPSRPPKNDHPPPPKEASIYQRPAVHQNGWFITATRMFQLYWCLCFLLRFNMCSLRSLFFFSCDIYVRRIIRMTARPPSTTHPPTTVTFVPEYVAYHTPFGRTPGNISNSTLLSHAVITINPQHIHQ